MSEFISLAELGDRYVDDNVSLHIPIPPYVEAEGIGINLDRIEYWMKLAGIASLGVQAVDLSLNRNIEVTSSGVNDDGTMSITGAKSSAKEKLFKTKNTRYDDKYPTILQNGAWIEASIRYNPDAIANSIEDSGKKLRDPHAWARRLNRVITGGIRESGSQHLMNITGFRLMAAAWINLEGTLLETAHAGMLDLISNQFDPQMFTAEDLALRIARTAVLLNGLLRILYRDKYRVSMFPGFEIDRLALLQADTRMRKAIKKL